MKKILLLIFSILFLTGCSVNVVYDFTDETISSNIDISFNTTDFVMYQNITWGEEANYSLDAENLIDYTYLQEGINVSVNSNKYYNKTSHNKESNNHDFLYNYTFTYKEFENNYIFKNCFDYFITIEKNDNYYYYLSGDYKCTFNENIYLKIKGNKVLSSNTLNVKNGVHTWNIQKKNNDISFIISKKEVEKTSSTSKIDIIIIMIVLLLSFVSFVLFKKIKNHI